MSDDANDVEDGLSDVSSMRRERATNLTTIHIAAN
jgi:hypothetical protein